MAKLIYLMPIIALAIGCSFNASISSNSKSTPAESPSATDLTPSTQQPSATSPQLGYSLPKNIYSTLESFSVAPTSNVQLSQFSVTPNLPTGIILNTSNGEISGAPTSPITSQSYTIKAIDSQGIEVSSTISFEVALTFLVTSTSDLSDANPGDGICSASNSFCTLRAAIEEANFQNSGITTVINIPNGTYGLFSQSLTINSRVILKGANKATTIIDANPDASPISPAIDISASSSYVVIEGLSIKNAVIGSAPAGTILGVGIKSLAENVEFKNCEISNNSISGTNLSTVLGVGIYHSSTGEFLMDNCTVSDNSTNLPNASGTSMGGGAHIVANSISISNSTITNNVMGTTTGASRGGGLAIYGASTISNSNISNNEARNAAAGIYYVSADNSQIKNSTLSENNSGSLAFGNFIYVPSNGVLDVLNSTMYKTSGSSPELIYVKPSAQLNVKNSTLFSSSGQQIIELESATANIEASTLSSTHNIVYFRLNTGQLTVKSSILTATNPVCTSHASPVTSYGYNVFSDSSCNTGNNTDLVNTDPQLGSLANNGGATMTFATGVSSPARGLVPLAECLAIDQRDTPRSSGNYCDAGSYQH